MKVELRERSLGEMIGLCFSLCVAHFGKLFVIVGLLGFPGLISTIVGAPLQDPFAELSPEEASQRGNIVLLMSILVFVIQPVQQGATILLVASSFTGDRRSLGECFRVAFGRFGGLLGYGLATGLIIGLGTLLLIIPGLIFFAWYFVGAPALILEKLSIGQAIGRSRSLSQGNVGKIIGLLVVAIVVLVAAAVGGDMAARAFLTGTTAAVFEYLIQVFAGMLFTVAPVAYYFQLRVKQEALDIDSLADLVEAIGQRGTPGEAAEA